MKVLRNVVLTSVNVHRIAQVYGNLPSLKSHMHVVTFFTSILSDLHDLLFCVLQAANDVEISVDKVVNW